MRVVAVSYLNTVPMIYGIEHASSARVRGALSLAVPSACAQSLIDKKADVALVPVAEIPNIEGAKIITDYCISSSGAVDTVALLSSSSLENIHTIYLDNHSRTSVQLVRILARELWGIAPRWVDNIPNEIGDNEAIVAIGDKVFALQTQFAYKWDLSEHWQRLTGLPFVFAAWVARTAEGESIEQELNSALEYGIEHIAESITADYDYPSAYKYLTENIQFRLDEPKRRAMKLFWEKIITPG